jgi:hypothetical protein
MATARADGAHFVNAIVRAPSLDSYPPLRSVGEGPPLPLVAAVRCACGGVLRQHAGDALVAIVGAHNATDEHRAWRIEREAL